MAPVLAAAVSPSCLEQLKPQLRLASVATVAGLLAASRRRRHQPSSIPRPPDSIARPVVVVDVGYGDARPGSGNNFMTFIPGAVHVRMEDIDLIVVETATGCDGTVVQKPKSVRGNFNLRPPRELRRNLERMGIHCACHVIVYTQHSKAGGVDVVAAARFAWCLQYAGVKSVLLVDGGMHSWKKAGLPVTNCPAKKCPVQDFLVGLPLDFPLHPEFRATTEDVEAALDARKGVLADVRSWGEYCGSTHGYPFDIGLGRIPSACFAHWGPSTYVGRTFCDHATGLFSSFSDVLALWQASGVLSPLVAGGSGTKLSGGEATGTSTPALGGAREETKSRPSPLARRLGCSGLKPIIFYCGSGWRSSLGWCVGRMLGVQDCTNYDGGWLEWHTLHPRARQHPVAVGDPNRAAAESRGAECHQQTSVESTSPLLSSPGDTKVFERSAVSLHVLPRPLVVLPPVPDFGSGGNSGRLRENGTPAVVNVQA